MEKKAWFLRRKESEMAKVPLSFSCQPRTPSLSPSKPRNLQISLKISKSPHLENSLTLSFLSTSLSLSSRNLEISKSLSKYPNLPTSKTLSREIPPLCTHSQLNPKLKTQMQDALHAFAELLDKWGVSVEELMHELGAEEGGGEEGGRLTWEGFLAAVKQLPVVLGVFVVCVCVCVYVYVCVFVCYGVCMLMFVSMCRCICIRRSRSRSRLLAHSFTRLHTYTPSRSRLPSVSFSPFPSHSLLHRLHIHLHTLSFSHSLIHLLKTRAYVV